MIGILQLRLQQIFQPFLKLGCLRIVIIETDDFANVAEVERLDDSTLAVVVVERPDELPSIPESKTAQLILPTVHIEQRAGSITFDSRNGSFDCRQGFSI